MHRSFIATRGILQKKVFLEISQNSQDTPVPELFFNKVAGAACEF